MKVPYTLLIIKPMTVGRGQASEILEQILAKCPVSLRMFRQWNICETTLFGLTRDKGPHISTLNYEDEKIHPPRMKPSWICIFTHQDRITDPTEFLEDLCGPLDTSKLMVNQLRYRYGGFQIGSLGVHPSDTVFHIAQRERAEYEAKLLFLDFKEDAI